MNEAFFLRWSGVNEELVSEDAYANERIKLAALGQLMFALTLLAFFLAFFAISYIADFLSAIIGGLVWAFFVYSIDLNILITVSKFENNLQKFGIFVIRLGLAFMVGSMLSIPFELKIFEKEITNFLQEKEDERIEEIRKQRDTKFQSEREKLILDKTSFESKIKSNKSNIIK